MSGRTPAREPLHNRVPAHLLIQIRRQIEEEPETEYSSTYGRGSGFERSLPQGLAHHPPGWCIHVIGQCAPHLTRLAGVGSLPGKHEFVLTTGKLNTTRNTSSFAPVSAAAAQRGASSRKTADVLDARPPDQVTLPFGFVSWACVMACCCGSSGSPLAASLRHRFLPRKCCALAHP